MDIVSFFLSASFFIGELTTIQAAPDLDLSMRASHPAAYDGCFRKGLDFVWCVFLIYLHLLLSSVLAKIGVSTLGVLQGVSPLSK